MEQNEKTNNEESTNVIEQNNNITNNEEYSSDIENDSLDEIVDNNAKSIQLVSKEEMKSDSTNSYATFDKKTLIILIIIIVLLYLLYIYFTYFQ